MKINSMKTIFFLYSIILYTHTSYSHNIKWPNEYFSKWADKSGFLKKLKRANQKPESLLKEIPGMLGEEYDHLIPYYMKYCATTKVHPYKGKGVEGSIAGHGLYYLKGVCKNPSMGPSGLKLCPAESDFTNPDTGTGLSVDKGLKNVNFVAIPGLRLFLAAPIYKKESLDFDIKNRIINEVLDKGVFSGVEFHENMVPATTLPKDYEEFLARYMFGSDYAISMARNLYCINIPLNRSSMGSLVDYFNHLNNAHKSSYGEKYRGIVTHSNKKDNNFYWNGIYNNCVHPGLNGLAQLGMIPHKEINKPLIQQVFNVAIPANTLLDIFESINKKDIKVDKIFADPVKRHNFLTHKWISQQPGGLVEAMKLTSPNEMFKQNDSIFIYPSIFKNRKKYLKEISSKPKYSVHGKGFGSYLSNYILFQEKYEKALEHIQHVKSKKRFRSDTITINSIQIDQTKNSLVLLKSKINNLNSNEIEKNELKKKLKFYENRIEVYNTAYEYVSFIELFENYIEKQLQWVLEIISSFSSYHSANE